MELTKVPHPSVEERRARGKALRQETPPGSHTGWKPAADRPDPVALLEEQNQTREADLVPVRHGRMMVSPFTFYRGAAKIMAADLKDTPRAGLVVQLCGDAHLSNFGVFASPERTLLFDLNDFDETLPGPFEYDLKRMAASFTIAARNNGFSKADERAATLASVTAYREAMAGFAEMGVMDVWYARLAEEDLLAAVRDMAATPEAKARAKARSKGRRRTKGRKGRRRRDSGPKRRIESPRRRTRETACRRSPSSASSSTARTGSSASHRSWCRCATFGGCLWHLGGRAPARDPPGVPRLSGHIGGRPTPSARAIRGHRHGPQGRRGGQRGHACLYRLASGARRARSAVPAGQRGDDPRCSRTHLPQESSPARLTRRRTASV